MVRFTSRLGGLIALLLITATVTVASAAWTSAKTAGPLPVATATLGVPTGLAVTVASCTARSRFVLHFAWTAPGSAPGLDGYQVYESTSATGPFTTLSATVSGTGTSVNTGNRTDWQVLTYFIVRSTARGWWSANSAIVSRTTPRRNNCA
jgi:hypothetical protein